MSFNKLKNRLISPPILALPRKHKPSAFDTDANAEKLGCILLKEQDDKSLRKVG